MKLKETFHSISLSLSSLEYIPPVFELLAIQTTFFFSDHNNRKISLKGPMYCTWKPPILEVLRIHTSYLSALDV